MPNVLEAFGEPQTVTDCDFVEPAVPEPVSGQFDQYTWLAGRTDAVAMPSY